MVRFGDYTISTGTDLQWEFISLPSYHRRTFCDIERNDLLLDFPSTRINRQSSADNRFYDLKCRSGRVHCIIQRLLLLLAAQTGSNTYPIGVT